MWAFSVHIWPVDNFWYNAVNVLCRPQEIDEAARRRFVKRLYIPLPELEARKTIIQNLLRQQSYHLSEDHLNTICSRTDGK